VLPAIPEVTPQAAAAPLQLLRPGSQTHIALGMPVFKRDDPDYYALIVGNYILGGGGFDARLMQELRSRRGLTYGVSSHFTPLQQAGPFVISLATRNAEAGSRTAGNTRGAEHYIEDGPTLTPSCSRPRPISLAAFPCAMTAMANCCPISPLSGSTTCH
jgi:zinc protease